MNELSKNLNFNKLFFRNHVFQRDEVENAIEHLAKYLKRSITSSSPFVMLTAYNHIKTVIAYYAILRIGKIAVILDPATKTLELTEMISDVDPAAIIFMNAVSLKWLYSEEVIFRKPNENFIIHSDLKDVCTIAYTNAEDGFSKGAMLTEKNLLAQIHAIIEIEKLDSSKVMCSLLPFNHLYGLVKGILVPTHVGCSAFIADINMFKIQDTVNEIRNIQVTNLYTVPSIYYVLAKIPGIDRYFESVNQFVSGGYKLSEFVYNNFYKNTNKKIREGYGLTECSPACTVHYQESNIKIDSVGQPFPGCEIKIFDNNDKECKVGEIGEICIKGDTVFKGYFNSEEQTKRTLKNGFLHTGDYGKVDTDGYVYFCGLKKNMINVAGVNVYPKELERYLLKFNKVRSVKISGESSILQGQIVKAYVKLSDNSKKTQEEFKNWCSENINNALLPKFWEFE